MDNIENEPETVNLAGVKEEEADMAGVEVAGVEEEDMEEEVAGVGMTRRCYEIHRIIAVSMADWRNRLAVYLKCPAPTGVFEFLPMLDHLPYEIEHGLYESGLHPVFSHPVLLFLYQCNSGLVYELYKDDITKDAMDVLQVKHVPGRAYVQEHGLSMYPIRNALVADWGDNTPAVIELFEGVGRVTKNPLQGTNYQLYALHALIDTGWYQGLKQMMQPDTTASYDARYAHYRATIGELAHSLSTSLIHNSDLNERARLIRDLIEKNKDITDISLMDGHGRTIARISEIFQVIGNRPLKIKVYEKYSLFNDLWHKNTMPLDDGGFFTAFGPMEEADIFKIFDEDEFMRGNMMSYLNFSGVGKKPFEPDGMVYTLFEKLIEIKDNKRLLDNLMISFNVGSTQKPAVNYAGVSAVYALASPHEFGQNEHCGGIELQPNTVKFRELLTKWDSSHTFVPLTKRSVMLTKGMCTAETNMGGFATMGLKDGILSASRISFPILTVKDKKTELITKLKWKNRGDTLDRERLRKIQALSGLNRTDRHRIDKTKPKKTNKEMLSGMTDAEKKSLGRNLHDRNLARLEYEQGGYINTGGDWPPFQQGAGGSKQKRSKKSRKPRRNTLKKIPRKISSRKPRRNTLNKRPRKTLKKRKTNKRSTKRSNKRSTKRSTIKY